MKSQVYFSYLILSYPPIIKNILAKSLILKRDYLVTLFLFISLICNAQSNFQKKVISINPLDNTLDAVYSNEFNNNIFVLRNFYGLEQYTGYTGLTMFNMNTGLVNISKSFSKAATDIIVNNAYSENGIVYMSVVINNAIEYTGGIIKYDMTTNSIIWAKKINLQGNSFIIKSIAGDNLNHLYVLGNYYNNTNSNNDLFLTKMDNDGNIIWSRIIGESTWDEIPSSIKYNGIREIYLSSVGFEGPFGKTTTVRVDSSGKILNSIVLATNSGPRFGMSFSALLNGNLYQVDKTVIGPSDPGPVLIRKMDSIFNIKSSIILNGIDPRNIANNKSSVLLSGQAPLSSGFKGFRTLRLDSGLNVEAARYFNNISTFSIATSASSFLNSSNNSFHFFTASGSDTMFFIKTDTLEISDCQDTSFTPASTIFNYSQVPYNVVSDTINLSLINFTVELFDFPFKSMNACETGTGISVTNKNDVRIFPNLGDTYINVAVQNSDNLYIEVFNELGQSVLREKKQNKMDISNLARGFYVINIVYEGMNTTHKFIKN
ncbi:MAG TPA: T9SS type A sorting domain-containing protein [Saprospiraceae bacterium]|nr:T9SS type A sorting domain-containing protein [Saprospiraceae bacterium]